jgi:thiol-disulfide isomerase/thioredoxin
VPEFLLATEDCHIVDSRQLVGREPFVVIFFASWCSVCEEKMPSLVRALSERMQEVTPVFVSLDEADAWSDTRAFAEDHDILPGLVVAGRNFLGFALEYNPYKSVPVVVIVGRSGRVVDVQVGVREGDEERFGQALDYAIEEPPEPEQFTSYLRR